MDFYIFIFFLFLLQLLGNTSQASAIDFPILFKYSTRRRVKRNKKRKKKRKVFSVWKGKVVVATVLCQPNATTDQEEEENKQGIRLNQWLLEHLAVPLPTNVGPISLHGCGRIDGPRKLPLRDIMSVTLAFTRGTVNERENGIYREREREGDSMRLESLFSAIFHFRRQWMRETHSAGLIPRGGKPKRKQNERKKGSTVDNTIGGKDQSSDFCLSAVPPTRLSGS